ncbi:unnamed protein product [Urochloa humidicola]
MASTAASAPACFLLFLLLVRASAHGSASTTAPLLVRASAHGSASTTAPLLVSASAHGSASTTAPLPAGGGLPLWVQRLLALGSGAPSLGAQRGKQFVVAPNGSGGKGSFSTIGAALEAAMADDPVGKGRAIIFIKEGVYEESLSVTRKHVIFIGEGTGKSVISGNKSVAFDKLDTAATATLSKCSISPS